MSRFSFGLRRVFRLRPNRDKTDDVVSRLRIDGAASQVVLLPYSSGLSYFVVPKPDAAALSISAEDFRVETLDLATSLWLRLRLALLFKKKKYLEFDEFSLFSTGVKPQRKRFTTFNQHMTNHGVALDGDFVTRHPELLTGWPEAEAPPARRGSSAPNAAAVVVHIYYEDTWPDFAEVLKRLTIPFDLIVTTVPGRERLIEAIRRDFPDADIEPMENRGRDVRPFLALLERGRLDRYRYVCKVHGKKSNDGGRTAYLGSLWRRRLLFDLLAGPNIAQTIVEAFERAPRVGMIGPRAFRLPSKLHTEELSWAENRDTVLKLAAKMGVPAERYALDFFGGTMFWVRPEALRPLRDLGLTADFPEEQGLLDGGLEHAVERLFATSVVVAGFRLADSDGYAVSEAANPAAGRAGSAPSKGRARPKPRARASTP